MSDPQKRYPPELRERAVRMVLEARAADPDRHRCHHPDLQAARGGDRIAAQLGEADPDRRG